MNNFEPTHVITLDNGDRIEVQLVDGVAYTREEWNAADQADYERQDNGDWTFQGQPFAGTVKAIERTVRRFEIGTLSNGIFQADTIGSDPAVTTFDTLEEAVAVIEETIAQAVDMWGEPMTNGAILDSVNRQIVWRQ